MLPLHAFPARPRIFSRSDRGICWMSGEGEGEDPAIAASAFLDGPAAELVVARAGQLREDYGNISGHAIGEGPSASRGMDVLGDVLKVFRGDEEQLWCERIAARLAEAWQDVYGEWSTASVAPALKPWGGAPRRTCGRPEMTARAPPSAASSAPTWPPPSHAVTPIGPPADPPDDR